MSQTDSELVQAALGGDSHAFEELVERYQRLVFGIVYHYVGFRGDAEDMAQEVFLKVYRSLDTYDTERPFKSWVSRITANTCLDQLRRVKKRKLRYFSDLSQEESNRLESFYSEFQQNGSVQESDIDELFGMLSRLMDKLHPKDKMAFVLRELEGLSYADISETMKTSEMAVRIRVSRARKRLQEDLTQSLSLGKELGHV